MSSRKKSLGDSLVRRMTRSGSLEDAKANVSIQLGRVFSSAVSITGIVIVAFAGVFMTSNSKVGEQNSHMARFAELAALGSEVGFSAFSDLNTQVVLIFAGGCILLLSSIIGFWSSHFENMKFVYLFSTVGLVGSALCIFGVVNANLLIADMVYIVCEEDGCNPRDGMFTKSQLELVTQELAMFDECCVANHLMYSGESDAYTTEKKMVSIRLYETRIQNSGFPVCPPEGTRVETVCQGVLPPIIEQVVPAIVPKLCTCIPREEADKYNSMRQSIRSKVAKNESNVCSALGSAVLFLPDTLNIPTIPLKLASILQTQYGQFFNQETLDGKFNSGFNIPVVGNPGPNWWLREEELIAGFGCGLGITKGFMWMFTIYVNDSLRPLLSASTIGSLVAAGFIVCNLVFLKMVRNTSTELELIEMDGMEKGGHSMQVAPSQALSGGSPQQSPRTSPRSSVNSVASTPSVSKTVAVSAKEKRDVEESLTAFYAKHDPSKLVDGKANPDVVAFSLTNGLAAINAKLKDKYGEDLETEKRRLSYRMNPTTQDNVIAGSIVKGDVDGLI